MKIKSGREGGSAVKVPEGLSLDLQNPCDILGMVSSLSLNPSCGKAGGRHRGVLGSSGPASPACVSTFQVSKIAYLKQDGRCLRTHSHCPLTSTHAHYPQTHINPTPRQNQVRDILFTLFSCKFKSLFSKNALLDLGRWVSEQCLRNDTQS